MNEIQIGSGCRPAESGELEFMQVKPTHVIIEGGRAKLLFDAMPNDVLAFVQDQATNPGWFDGIKLVTDFNMLSGKWQTTVILPPGVTIRL